LKKTNKESEFEKFYKQEKSNVNLKIHSFHRYYGKLIPAIPRSAILKYSNVNDLIFDPFTGSGTTGVEAVNLTRNFLGVEINKLSRDISYVKTHKLDENELQIKLNQIINEFNNDKLSLKKHPFVINIDHWFKEKIQVDLLKIQTSIDKTKFLNDDYKLFFNICLSAIIKNVSNADERHVFPGVSIRMRKLEEIKPIEKNVIKIFENAVKKRIKNFKEVNLNNVKAEIIVGDTSQIDLSEYSNKIDLIVTNPPYISSVRYVETLKLEMYWMEYITSQFDYKNLAKSNIGNDLFNKSEYSEVFHTKYNEINSIIDHFKIIDMKSAKIVYEYFSKMEIVIEKCSKLLKKGRRLVMKIGDSHIKKLQIKTGEILSLIAEYHGFEIEDYFVDEIKANSRSLTSARNTYSGIIMFDYIYTWKKIK
jgi:DNA modification methylase